MTDFGRKLASERPNVVVCSHQVGIRGGIQDRAARTVQAYARLMDEQIVRERAQALCEALLAGDIGKASGDMSPELQRNLGPVVALLPLPLTEASIATVEMTGSGYRAVLDLAGESGSMQLETRWKERDGKPTMVEASHIHEEPMPTLTEEAEEEPPA